MDRGNRHGTHSRGRLHWLLVPVIFWLFVASDASALRIYYDPTPANVFAGFTLGFWTPPPVVQVDRPPYDLLVRSDRGTRLEIEFRCVLGADRYDYLRQVDGGGYDQIGGGLCSGGVLVRFIDLDVLPRENYCYIVRARNANDQKDSDPLCLTTGGIPRVPARSDLDRPVAMAALGELEMTTGRLSKIPVSAFWTSPTGFFEGGVFARDHDIQFRALCGIELTLQGRCDTGLFVHYESCESDGQCQNAMTIYNDDDSRPRDHGDGSGSGSFVDPPRQRYGVSRYTVHLFSRLRATSRARLEYSLDSGGSWITASSEMEVGGTLIDVGALHPGDWLEAETATNGNASANTRMLLFHPSSSEPVLVGDDQSGADADPRIQIEEAGFERGANLLLVGKQQSAGPVGSQGPGLEAVETWVDLTHGPRQDAISVSNIDCDGPCSMMLKSGRYLLWTYAKIDQPVGSVDVSDPGQNHLSGDMPVVETCDWAGPFGGDKACKECPNDARDGQGDATWYRGRTNDVALSLDLQKRSCAKGELGGVCYWQTLETRDVTRAVLGTDPTTGGWNLLSMELDASSLGEYRLAVREHVAGLEFHDQWRYQRNPEATELKVVSFNTLFGDGPKGRNPERYRNMANLLGTRGRIDTQDGRVEMRPDQAPFQWEADIVAAQEISKGDTDGDSPDFRYSDVALVELMKMSSLDWLYSIGRGESWWNGIGDGPGMNTIFLNEFHQAWPGPWFGPQAKAAADCSTKGHGAKYMECKLGEQGIGHGDTDNFAIPAKARARRAERENDRPIAVFNVHLEASTGPADFLARLGEVESLIEKIDALLATEPEAFNRSGSPSPRHYQNRIIIAGDWNIRCHYCGEQYWLLRMLREHYGYAVDTSMAVLDRDGRPSFGMHDQGYPIGANGVPTSFQHQEHPDLENNPPAWDYGWREGPLHTGDSVYPWWAADYRNTTSGPEGMAERLSAVFLIGRGWAYDDPVLDYRLMNDRGWPSPMHESPNAVEMWRPDECGDTGSVPFGRVGYAPNHSLGCDESSSGGTNPGAPALHSDHKPIGVRLRVWQR